MSDHYTDLSNKMLFAGVCTGTIGWLIGYNAKNLSKCIFFVPSKYESFEKQLEDLSEISYYAGGALMNIGFLTRFFSAGMYLFGYRI
jgi:hypothetical protein